MADENQQLNSKEQEEEHNSGDSSSLVLNDVL